jgi:hypothetical protein
MRTARIPGGIAGLRRSSVRVPGGRLGAALALGTVLLGTVLHLAWAPFEYPEISIPIAVVGTFLFPFVLFQTMWNALSKRPDA